MSESTANGHAPAAWLPDVLAYLEEIKGYKANWDGYNADAPRPEVVDAAAAFIREVAARTDLPVPYTCPTRIGGVGFHWDHGPHRLEVEWETPTYAEFGYLNVETDKDESGPVGLGFTPDSRFQWYVDLLNKDRLSLSGGQRTVG
jgi:hypothetical protein